MNRAGQAHAMRIDSEDDIIAVRRRVREFAEARKFDSFATAAITTAASELARNALVHGGKGVAFLTILTPPKPTLIPLAIHYRSAKR